MTQEAARVSSTRDRGASLEGTETKAFAKTSEFIVWVATVAAVLIASYLVDTFDAYDAWRFITYLSIAIGSGSAAMVSTDPTRGGVVTPRSFFRFSRPKEEQVGSLLRKVLILAAPFVWRKYKERRRSNG
jgi:MFS family permease